METEYIPFSRPHVGKEEEEAVLRVLRSGWLTTGAEALTFEKEFAVFLEAGTVSSPAETVLSDSNRGGGPPPLWALAVNSATSGLHLALEACGIGPGDLVLLPSYTFTATAEAARYLGAEPVFVDVAPGSFHMDTDALERTLARLDAGLPAYPRRGGFGPRGKAKAVIPVHYGGLPCDMDRIGEIARRRGLRVIEDAAHSFPSRIPAVPAGTGDSRKAGTGDSRFAGTLGDVGVFSFYATKTITTGEGGMVVSRDQALVNRISIMRSHGIDRTVWNRYTDKRASWYYEVVEAGFKYNIPDILAALGRVQLKKARFLLEKREAIARRYDEAFGGDGHFFLPPTGVADARHLYPLRLNLEELSLTREGFIEKLQEQGIGVSVHFIPLHTMPYYRQRYALKAEDFPESVKSFKGVISLPIWPGMEENHLERVITAVKKTADMS
ncbi:MAG: DegT/DnrJ/EryC1/StrS aminotransferase family protein [Spirochaetaceae bacterium]|jgi:dTDP-4-amino-4,6-dideoxygalactose transaminase|nr:DegT/DnrJ/EryC1/StrS aminotransferase family protein [Spirochaetaceae bacterium]